MMEGRQLVTLDLEKCILYKKTGLFKTSIIHEFTSAYFTRLDSCAIKLYPYSKRFILCDKFC